MHCVRMLCCCGAELGQSFCRFVYLRCDDSHGHIYIRQPWIEPIRRLKIISCLCEFT